MDINSIAQHKVVRFGNLKFWCERGLICIENTADGDYKTVSVRTELQRMKAIQDMLKNSRSELHASGVLERAAFDDNFRMLEEMVDTCRRAQAQGMPDDPRAKNWLKDARPKTVAVPQEFGGF